MNTDTAVQWDVFGVLFMDHALPKLIYDRASMRILEVNHAAVRNYGYDRAYFRNMTILDLHIPEHVEDIARLVREGDEDAGAHERGFAVASRERRGFRRLGDRPLPHGAHVL